jgi:AraC-like DNA-binding protein
VHDAPYRETAPPLALAGYVDRFWSRRSTSIAGAPHRVLPDGCVDLLVDLAAGTAELVGPMSRAALVPSVRADIVAARFRPGAGARFAGVPLAALIDESVPLGDLGIDARPLLDALACGDDRSGMLGRFMRDRLADAPPLDRLVRRAVQRLTRETSSIAAITQELGVSRQYLARVFTREVGVAPKVLGRIARMQRVMLAIRAGRRDWSRLAIEHGFSDQAHLVHDATELTGLCPTRLADEVSISPIASLFGAVEGPA